MGIGYQQIVYQEQQRNTDSKDKETWEGLRKMEGPMVHFAPEIKFCKEEEGDKISW
jgi:hypothetical protein